MSNQSDELFAALQRLLPQHLASRLLSKLADSETAWVKDRLIQAALNHYDIDLSEAVEEDASSYPSFNAFFTRGLKPGARIMDATADSLVSPADGTVSQAGNIIDGQIFQAKGHWFTPQALLGSSTEDASAYVGGSFITVYLSPRDYHRVHLPVAGRLVETRYIPGKLFSVNAATTRQIPGLFARNERLCCFFDTDFGKIAVVLVGALFVAGIETVWQTEFQAGRLQHRTFSPELAFDKGDEIGRFKFGSTVIVLSEKSIDWTQGVGEGYRCLMGENLGKFSE